MLDYAAFLSEYKCKIQRINNEANEKIYHLLHYVSCIGTATQSVGKFEGNVKRI